MASILSAVSGQFSKGLILGAFLPATIFVLLWIFFVEPLFPAGHSLLEPFGLFGTAWEVFAVTFLTVVLTGLLYNFNIPLIRFYEGYPWKESWLGRSRVKHYQTIYRDAKARWTGMRTLQRTQEYKTYSNEEEQGKIWLEWNRRGRQKLLEFPDDINRVLPTRLGNTIRSFEYYPEAQYEMEAITLWVRLIAKIDKDYAAVIDDAKTSFDFMLNCSVLSVLLALSILIVGLDFPPTPLSAFNRFLPWTINILFFLGLGYLFYLGSIPRAGAWGDHVKGSFDLYRWDLLKQLGYQQVPKTRIKERELWDKISLQMLYGDRPDGPRVDYTDPATAPNTYATGEPADIELTVTRGASQSENQNGLTIYLEVKNCTNQHEIREVKVSDVVPEGFEYEWSSAQYAGKPVEIEGTNPYVFKLGTLAGGAESTVTYRILPQPKKE